MRPHSCGSIKNATPLLACPRRSDSRAREKNSRRKKMKETREGKGESSVALAPPPVPFPPSRFLGVQFNSLPTYRRALLSEPLEQATPL